MERIITNLTGLVRNEKLEGKDCLVVPMVMIVEGVLNGSGGPLYYPAEELAKVPAVWNHKPVVVYHPTMGDQPISACDPATINAYKVGVILNTKWDGKRLSAEAWLNPDRLELVDKRVSDAINANQMMEVSTGLFTDNEATPGVFNGIAYNGVARNLRPDHLAILPDQIGACSIADGAGLLRVNATNKKELHDTLVILGIVDNVSHDAIHSALYAALGNKDGLWIEDVFDSSVVYTDNGKLYKRTYRMEDSKAILEGIAEEVFRVVQYQSADGTVAVNTKKESTMKTNAENTLDTPPVDVTPDTETPPVETPPADAPAETPPVEGNAKPTLSEYVSAAPPEIQEVLNEALATRNARREATITTIMANSKNTLTKEVLEGMPTAHLTAIASIATVEAPVKPVGNYSGLAPVAPAVNPTTSIEPLLAPVMNFKKD